MLPIASSNFRWVPLAPAERIDIAVSPYYGWVIERLIEAIKPDASAGEAPELPAIEANRPNGTTGEVDFWTSREVRPVINSHVNYVSWSGVGAPKATPAEIVDKLNKEVNAALDDPKMKARLADLGGVALQGSPADFGKLIADETEKWGKVIKFAGIKSE